MGCSPDSFMVGLVAAKDTHLPVMLWDAADDRMDSTNNAIGTNTSVTTSKRASFRMTERQDKLTRTWSYAANLDKSGSDGIIHESTHPKQPACVAYLLVPVLR